MNSSFGLLWIKIRHQMEFTIICVYKDMIIEYTIQFKIFLDVSSIKIKRYFNYLIVQDITKCTKWSTKPQ